jgi:catechol 2,3-dioxygenase-like lactoylglutathione lyase family enzyme
MSESVIEPVLDPIIRVADVAFPRFQAPDLDRMEAFLTDFGMHRAARTASALYMRGTDPQHHVHVTHLGEKAFLGLAFRAASRDDLATLAAAVGGAVEPTGEPGGGELVRLTDPDGRRIDVVHGIAPQEPLPLRGHAPYNDGSRRVRVGTLLRVAPGPSQVKRCGHAAIKTADLDRLWTWYRRHLGLLVSDDLYVEEPGRPLGRFARCDRGGEPADHHVLLFLAMGEAKLGHVAWEVADLDDLMVGHDRLLAAGARPYWGIGRHILGGQIFDYWKDPLGFTVEHWTDTDLLVASTPAGSHHLLEGGGNQWGPPAPADLDF